MIPKLWLRLRSLLPFFAAVAAICSVVPFTFAYDAHSTLAAETTTSRVLTEAEAKLYGRVSHPQGFQEQVWEMSKAPDGNVYDPTGRILKFDEPWELGHTPANKFSDAQLRAAQEGWDRQTWIRYQNDPAIYRPELPSSNASHKWE